LQFSDSAAGLLVAGLADGAVAAISSDEDDDESPPEIHVVVNWFDELRRKVAAAQ
jgi:hypothetical protein